jgi:hypothetical protein
MHDGDLGVDPPTLGNMGVLERLDDPVITPTKIHVNCYKEEHKERGRRPRMRHVGPRDATIDGCIGLFGCNGSTKGHVSSFGNNGSRSDVKHPKDATIHEGDIWSPYKSTRAQNQRRKKKSIKE